MLRNDSYHFSSLRFLAEHAAPFSLGGVGCFSAWPIQGASGPTVWSTSPCSGHISSSALSHQWCHAQLHILVWNDLTCPAFQPWGCGMCPAWHLSRCLKHHYTTWPNSDTTDKEKAMWNTGHITLNEQQHTGIKKGHSTASHNQMGDQWWWPYWTMTHCASLQAHKLWVHYYLKEKNCTLLCATSKVSLCL